MAPAIRSSTVGAIGRLSGALAVLSAAAAASYLLFPAPLADVFFAGWVLVAVGLAVVGGVAAWTNRTPLAWAAALLLTGLSIAGMWSIGLFVAPAAVFLLVAALLSQLAGTRTDVRERIVADPLATRDAVLGTLAGAGALAGGGWLVYRSAFAIDLFGACARETLGCVVATTRWTAVGITLLGLVAIGLGAWLLWRPVYAARVLAAERTG
jgi:hypothetical protein